MTFCNLRDKHISEGAAAFVFRAEGFFYLKTAKRYHKKLTQKNYPNPHTKNINPKRRNVYTELYDVVYQKQEYHLFDFQKHEYDFYGCPVAFCSDNTYDTAAKVVSGSGWRTAELVLHLKSNSHKMIHLLRP